MSNIPPIPQNMKEQMVSSKPVPKGYVSADNKLTPEVVYNARKILQEKSLGYTEEKIINNTKFFFRCEPHYDNHLPDRVYRWHKGVSVYTPKEDLIIDMNSNSISQSTNSSNELKEFIGRMQSAMEEEIKKLIG